MKEKETGDLHAALSQNFDLESMDANTLDEIKASVVSVIRALLDKNMEKLFSILYRIDVSQKVTDEIFKIESKDDIASQLADAIINRQLQKIHTRMRFRNERDQRDEGKWNEIEID